MICVSIAHIGFSELELRLPELDMLELRLDLLDFSDKEYQFILASDKTIIATYRYGNVADKIREKALQRIIDLGAEYVDIEIDAAPQFVEKMIAYARAHQCKTILSYHNFELTPGIEEHNNIIKQAKQLGADYIKIVTQASSKEDVVRTLSLYKNQSNLIAFNMGEMGKISRLSSLYLGADFTYAALSNEKVTADGQFDYRTLQKLMELIK